MCRLFLWYIRASVILFGYPHTKGYYDNRWQGKCSKLAPYTAFIYFSTAEGIPLAAIPGSAWTCYPSFDLLMASVTSQCPLFLSMRQLLTLKWLPEQQQEASKQWVQFIVVIRSSQLGLKRVLEKWVLQVHRVSQKTLHEPCWLFTFSRLGRAIWGMVVRRICPTFNKQDKSWFKHLWSVVAVTPCHRSLNQGCRRPQTQRSAVILLSVGLFSLSLLQSSDPMDSGNEAFGKFCLRLWT